MYFINPFQALPFYPEISTLPEEEALLRNLRDNPCQPRRRAL